MVDESEKKADAWVKEFITTTSERPSDAFELMKKCFIAGFVRGQAAATAITSEGNTDEQDT